MISIIICSRSREISSELQESIKETIGTQYELIAIDNSTNSHSIFSAYNHGIKQSQYPYLCMIHEDVRFHSNNWGEKIITHLKTPNVGIIGIAGGGFVSQVPTSWSKLDPCINITQHKQNSIFKNVVPAYNKDPKRPCVLLDGVFLAMNSDLCKNIQFDEDIKGFHGYDFDITLHTTAAGKQNYVIYDISVEHFSNGRKDLNYYRKQIHVFKKWEKILPIYQTHTKTLTSHEILKEERRRLKRLSRQLVKVGMSDQEIISNINYYSRLIGYDIPLLPLTIRMQKWRYKIKHLFVKS